MSKNENGVSHYAIGTATVNVAFANGQISCQNCEYLYNDRGLGRCRCELQHSKIIPLDCIEGRDINCPIKFEQEDE
jgi:hypothetical protein